MIILFQELSIVKILKIGVEHEKFVLDKNSLLPKKLMMKNMVSKIF